MHDQRRRCALMSLSALLAVTLAACGGSAGSDSAQAGGAGRPADTSSVPAPTTTPPTKITVTTPLAAAPTAGRTFFWLQCELPICEKITTGVQAAVAAAGWNYENLVFKSDDPAGGLESALQRNPDAIGITGIPSAAIKSQLAAAAAAGIPVVTCSPGPEEPSPQTFGAICSRTTEPDGRNLALWAIKDSGGAANIVSVTVPSYPSLKTTTDGVAQTVQQYCPACTADVLDVTVDELAGGRIPAKLVAYLQSHPNVNYVLFTFADLQIGVPQTLKAAGMDTIKLIGTGAGPAQFEGIINGGMDAAWGTFPAQYEGWLMVDAAIRLVDGGGVPPGYQSELDALPTYIVDTPAAAQELAPTFDFTGPAGYEEQFTQLWSIRP
jgi:ABC-type sugar transport system substrate-binding protein